MLLLKETSGFDKKVNPPQVMEVTLLQMLLCPRTHETNVKSVTGIKRETSKINKGQPVKYETNLFLENLLIITDAPFPYLGGWGKQPSNWIVHHFGV